MWLPKPKTAEMPIKQGKSNKIALGLVTGIRRKLPKITTKQVKKRQKDKWFHFHAPTGVGTGKGTGKSMRTRLSKPPFSKPPFSLSPIESNFLWIWQKKVRLSDDIPERPVRHLNASRKSWLPTVLRQFLTRKLPSSTWSLKMHPNLPLPQCPQERAAFPISKLPSMWGSLRGNWAILHCPFQLRMIRANRFARIALRIARATKIPLELHDRFFRPFAMARFSVTLKL